jgi:hypothetical protein
MSTGDRVPEPRGDDIDDSWDYLDDEETSKDDVEDVRS